MKKEIRRKIVGKGGHAGNAEGVQLDGAGIADGANGCFQHGIMFAAEQLGYNDGTADAAADGNSHENHGDGIGCPYSCQRLLPDEPRCDDAVGNVVKLLQQISCDHRQGKQDKRAGDFPAGQIVIHKETSFRT